MRFSFSFGDLGLPQLSSEPVSSQTKTVLPKTGSIAPLHHASMVRFSSFEIRSFCTVKNDTHSLQVVHITGLLPHVSQLQKSSLPESGLLQLVMCIQT